MVSVYTDGSSHARGGLPGGWSYIILIDGKPFATHYGGDTCTSNNRMELTAALKGLQHAKLMKAVKDGAAVELVSDSEYVLGIAAGRFAPSKNLDLCEPLTQIFGTLRARARHVRGHSGDPMNERCDRLAKRGKEAALAAART